MPHADHIAYRSLIESQCCNVPMTEMKDSSYLMFRYRRCREKDPNLD